jgi:hypothetical protein
VTLLSDLPPRLADDAVFHSPVATYRGRADVAHLIAKIGGVVSGVEARRTLVDGDTRVTFIDLRVGELDADGVLEEVSSAGEIVELRLMLRPLTSVHAAVKAMGAALAADPLPSQRR